MNLYHDLVIVEEACERRRQMLQEAQNHRLLRSRHRCGSGLGQRILTGAGCMLVRVGIFLQRQNTEMPTHAWQGDA